jgi:hypothetical protein
MTRQERKAIQARAAVGVLTMQAAKREVKAQIRARGERLWDFTGRDITRWATQSQQSSVA